MQQTWNSAPCPPTLWAKGMREPISNSAIRDPLGGRGSLERMRASGGATSASMPSSDITFSGRFRSILKAWTQNLKLKRNKYGLHNEESHTSKSYYVRLSVIPPLVSTLILSYMSVGICLSTTIQPRSVFLSTSDRSKKRRTSQGNRGLMFLREPGFPCTKDQ